MNILPFVAIFLIILATLSYGFLDKSKTLAYEKEVAISYLKVERRLLEKLHKEAFKKAPRKKSSTLASDASAKPVPKIDTDPRLSPRDHSLAKMNLFPLFNDNCPVELHLLCQNLLKACYHSCSFFETATLNQTLQELLNGMIKTGKEKIALCIEKKEDLSLLNLSDFYPTEPSQHAIFYKMLKGTHVYTLGSQGYPPLEDFFFFQEEKTPMVLHFPSLSKEMLEVIFGKEEANAILAKECDLRSKNPERVLKTLSKEELASLLHEQFPSKTYFDKMIQYLGFTPQQKKKNKIISFDEKTSIKIEKEKL